jgi:autotransporter-associated beta strand protein
MTANRNARRTANAGRSAFSSRKHGLFGSTALVPVIAAFATSVIMLNPGMALAQQGGNGGNSPGSGGSSNATGAGGDGGTTGSSGGGGGAGATGGGGGASGGAGGASAGASGSNGVAAGSGGGGGAHGFVGLSIVSGPVTGGSGGAGAASAAGAARGGGGGGAGGYGAVATGSGNLGSISIDLLGGTGGAGGSGGSGSFGGNGGFGGTGLALTGNNATITINSPIIAGGNGGNGGALGTAGGGSTGVSGSGGVGLQVLGSNSVVTIGASASVSGGNGGGNLNGATRGGGGAGITGGNLTLIVAGSVTGGTGLFGQANAVTFTGGTNILEIRSGATFTGNVVANSSADSLRLGGSTNGTLSVSDIGSGSQYRGFGLFEKSGTSTWTLTGSTTAATPWSINGGTLSISADNNLGNSGALTFGGGTLVTTAGFSSARDITLNAGGGTIAPAANTSLTLSGLISGSGTLVKADSGTLILTGNSTGRTGLTQINAGILQLGSGASAASLGTGSITVAAGASLVANSSAEQTIAGSISGDGSLVLNGSGTVKLLSNNTHSGGTIINAGTAQFGFGSNNAAVVPGNIRATLNVQTLGTGSVTLNGGDLLYFIGTSPQDVPDTSATVHNNLIVTGNVGNRIRTGGTYTIGFDGTLTLDGTLRVNLAATGANAVFNFSSATVSPTSVFIIDVGSVNQGLGGTIGFTATQPEGYRTLLRDASAVFVNSGFSLNGFGGTITNLRGSSSGTISHSPFDNSPLTIGGGDFSGVLSSNAGNTIISTGNLILRGTSGITFNADLRISSGTVTAINPAVLGTATGAVRFFNTTGKLVLDGTGTVLKRVVLETGTAGTIAATAGAIATFTNTFSLGTNSTLRIGSATETGTIVLTPGAATTGTGALLSLDGGTLQFGNANGAAALGSFDSFNIASGATLDMVGRSATVRNLSGAGSINNLSGTAVTLTSQQSGMTTFAGNIGNGAIGLGLAVTGGGTLILTGLAFPAGASATIDGGSMLAFGNGGTTGDFAAPSISSSTTGTLAINRSNTLSLASVLSGSLGLAKQGSGTLVLGSDSNITGTTTISGGTLQIGSGGTTGNLGTGTIVNNAVLAINRSNAVTLTNAISGTGIIRNIGTGTLTLNGDLTLGGFAVDGGTLVLGGSNTLTNGITVGGGTLRLANSNAAGGATGQITTTGSVIDYADGVNVATPILLNSNTTQLQITSGTAVQSGAISETGGSRPLEKIGNGILELAGINTYSGGTTVSAGTLRVSIDANLGAATGGLTLAGGSELDLVGTGFSSARSITLASVGNISVNTGRTATLAGAISGAAPLLKLGAGTLILAGNNSFGTLSVSGTAQIGGGGTSGTLGTGGVSLASGSTLIFNRSDNITVSNILGGSGSLTKRGTGTLSLTGSNSYLGNTLVEAGTLAISTVAALGSGTNITVLSGATLATAGNLALGARSLTLAGTGADGNGALQMSNLPPANAVAVTTSGQITLTGDTLIGLNTGVLFRTDTLGITSSVSAALTIDSRGNANFNANAPITGISSLTKTGTGGLELRGVNTFTGPVTVNGGSLEAYSGAAIGDLAAVSVASGAVFGTSASETIGSLSGAGSVLLRSGSILTVGGNNTSTTYSGAMGDTGSLVKTGTGTLTMTGANVYFGSTTISAGTLQIGNGGTTGDLLNTSGYTNNATLAFNRSNDITVNSLIAGSGVVRQQGSGTLILAGANSFGDGVTLEQGTVALSTVAAGNLVGLGTGTLSFAGNGTLQTRATGTVVLPNISVAAGVTGTLAAQTGTTTSITSSIVTLAQGSTLAFGSATLAGTVVLNSTTSAIVGTAQQLAVAGGTLRLGNAGAATLLNQLSGGTVVGTKTAAATLDINGQDTTIRNLSGSSAGVIRNDGIRSSTLILNNTADSIFTGSITDGTRTIQLQKQGTGMLTLTGTNSYTAGTVINAGTLRIGNGGTTGTLGSGTISMLSSGTLEFNRSDNLTVSNFISGTGTITKSGTNTLTLGGANSLAGALNVNGGTLILGDGAIGTQQSGAVSIANGATLAFGGSGNSSVGNSITGSGSVLMNGTGTVTIGFPGSSFTGGTTINSGVLSVARTGGLGIGAIRLNGGVLQGADGVTLANNLFVNDVTGNRIEAAANGTMTLSGALSVGGAVRFGSLTATGGTVRIGSNSVGIGANAAVFVDSGTLVGTTNILGALTANAVSTTLVGSTAILDLGGFNGTIANLQGSGTLLNGTATTTIASGNFSGVIGGGQSILSTGALTLSGANTFSGSLTVQSGTLQVSNAAGFGTTAGGTIVASGATLELAGNNNYGTEAFTLSGDGVGSVGALRNAGVSSTLGGTITLAANARIGGASATTLTLAGALDGGGFGLTLGGAGAINITGVLGNLSSLTKDGTGTLALSGTNTFTGDVTVNGGILSIFGGASIGDSAAVTLGQSGQLSVNSNETIGRLSGRGPVLLLNASLTTNIGSTDSTFGSFSGSGDFIKLGTGTLTILDASSSSDGSLRINEGAVQLGDGGDTGGLLNTAVVNNGTLIFNRSGDGSLSRVISGTGSLIKRGTSDLSLSGLHTFIGGVTVETGRLLLNTAGTLSTSNLLTIASGATVQTGLDQTLGALSGAGTFRMTSNAPQILRTLTLGASNVDATFTGAFSELITTLSLVKQGTGKQVLNTVAGYTGTTTVDGGTLEFAGAIGGGQITVNSAGRLALSQTGSQTLANLLTGSGAVDKNNNNVLTLSTTNTNASRFTGTLNINAGSLIVSSSFGDLTGRTATVNVLNGGTLGGSGTIHGNVSVASGGILAPGTSPGTQTIAGNLTLDAGSILNFELAQAGVIGGGINDLISVGGNLTLAGTLNVTALAGFGAGYYRLFNYGGTLTNNGLAFGTTPDGFTRQLLTDVAGQVNVLFNAGAQVVQYWDGIDLTGASATVNGNGGLGVWNASATNWTNPTGFALNTNWGGQVGVFAGAAGGTVTLVGAQSFQELRFVTGGYQLGSQAPGNGSLATTGGFSVIDVASGISAEVNTPITGAGGLTKTGAGTLTLGGASTFSGLTTNSAGTLALATTGVLAGAVQNNATFTNAGTITGLFTNAGTLSSTGALNGGLTNNAGATATLAGAQIGAVTNAGTITLIGTSTLASLSQNAGGTFNLNGFPATLGSLSGTGNVALNFAALTVGGNNSSTSFAGAIAGPGTLTKTGTGTLTLSGMNSYAGLTTVNGGTLALAGGGSLAGPVQNNAGFTNAGTVNGLFTNAGTLASTGTLGGGLANNAGATANLSGTVAGAVSNSGTITLTGLTSGIGALTQQGTGTLNLAGFATSIGSLSGSGAINLGAAVLTVGSLNSSTSFAGAIAGSGGLTKTGTGTLTLSGANMFAGLTTIGSGALTLASGGSLAGAVQNSAALTNAGVINGLVTNTGTLVSTGTLGGGLTNTSLISAQIAGTLNGNVSNSGTIALTNALTGSSAFSQTAGGVFNLAGFNASIGSLSGTGTVTLGSATLTLGGANGSFTYAGVISGSGGLTKTGTGTQTLGGANSFAGTILVSAGTLALSATGALAGPVTNNATLTNAGLISGAVTNAGLFSNTGVASALVTNGGTLTSTGQLNAGLTNNAGATASLANMVTGAVSNAGTINLTGATSGIAGFNQDATGTLNLAGFNTSIGSLNGSGRVQLGSGTLTLGADNSASSFAGTIAGSGGLTKAGSGALTLTGSNTAENNFTGTVNVTAGSLVLNGSLGDAVANTAALNVANGASVGGSGTFLGNLALTNGGIFAPGNSPGTLAIGGNLLLDASSVLNFELAQAGVVGGGINDLITVGGNLTLDGTLNVTGLPGFGAGIYRLFNYGGALTDNGLLLGLRPDGFTHSLVTSVAGQVSIQLTFGVPTVLYWDGSDSTAASSAVNGDGGSGIWSSEGTNWTSAPGFNTSFAWGSQTGVFAGAAGGTVQVSGAQAFQQLRFETGGYALTTAAGGGSLTTTGGTSIIDVSAALSATIDTRIDGTAGLTKSGAGTLTLGGANSYFGLTSVAAGTLALASGGTIAGAVANNATFSNAGTVAGLVTNSGMLISTSALNGGLTNNAGASASIAVTLAGVVSNAGSITLTGATSGIGALSQTGTGTLNLANFATTVGSISGAGAIQLGSARLTAGDNNASTSFAGMISGSGGLTKNGTGTLTLSGANSYTGATFVNAGALAIGSGGSLASGVNNSATLTNAGTIGGSVSNTGTVFSTGTLNGGLSNTGTGTVFLSGQANGTIFNQGNITLTGVTTGIGSVSQNAGTFNLNGFNTSFGNLAGSGGTIALGSATLTLGSNGISSTFDGTITGAGSLSKIGTGTFSLSGASSYSGLTTVNSGTLILGANGALAGAVTNNATVSTNGRIAGLFTNNAALTSTGTLAGGLVNAANATANIRGAVGGNVANAGTIILSGAASMPGAFVQASAGRLSLGTFDATLGSLAGSGSVALGSAMLTSGGDNSSTVFSGVLVGSGSLIKTGTGTFTLTGANTFTGLSSINGGALALTATGSLAGSIANNATFVNAGSLAGLVTNAGGLVSTGALNGGLVNNAGAAANVAGTLAGAVSNAGLITLTGTTTGIGAFTQASTGGLNIAGFDTAISSLAGSGAVQLGAATLAIGGNNASTAFDGAIAGTGGITKTGTGALALSGASSFDGLTNVAQGVLSVRNAGALGSAVGGSVVADGAALELQGGISVLGEALTLNGSGIGGTGALRNVADSNIWDGTVTLASDSTIFADAGRLDIALLAGTTQSLTTGGAGLIGLANATLGGALNVTGGSTALFGSGNFAGGVNVSGGALFLQGGTSIADGAAVNLGNGAIIVGVSETIGSLSGTGGTVQIDSGQTLTLGGNNASTSFAGTIFNTGNLVKQGSGTFTVTGTLAHTGTTTIGGGTLLSGAANIWQATGPVTIATNGTLDLGGFDQSIATVNLAGGTLANGALTGAIVSTVGTVRDIGGGANSLLANAGTTVLSGSGSFAQGLTLAGGNVTLQGAGASIADIALVTVNAGTLAVNVGETIGALAGSGGTVQIASGQTLTTGGSNASTGFAGVIAGAGGLVKTGSGVMTLSGANTLTGLTTVSAGTLALTGPASLAGPVRNNAGFSNAGTIAGLVTNAGTLISSGTLNGGLVNSGAAGLSGRLNGSVSNGGLVQLQGTLTGITAFDQASSGQFDLANFATSIGSLSGGGMVSLGSATLTLGGSNASTSFGGTITGTGGLVKTGSGTFTLTSGQAFTGLATVSGGTLVITSAGGLSGSLLNNATLQSAGVLLGSLTNNGTALLQGTINGSVTNTSIVNLGGSLRVLGRFDQAASGSFNLAGFASSVGSMSGAGSVQLGSANLQIGSDNISSLFAGVMSGSGGITKLGSGTLTLTGVNSYTGLTVVDAGTLVIGQPSTGTATVAGSAAVAPAPAAIASTISAEQAASPAAVTLAASEAAMPAAASLAGETAASTSAPVIAPAVAAAASGSPAARAGMIVDNGGGLTPATLTASAERASLTGSETSNPERVDLFADPIQAMPVTAGVVTAITSLESSGRLALTADLSNGLVTARLDNGSADMEGGAQAIEALAAEALAGPAPVGVTSLVDDAPSSAVIAGSVLNNANVINNGAILGQLMNSAGAVTVNTGVIRGGVTNRGTLTSIGTIQGGLDNSGTARISGVLAGTVLNSGSITLTGTMTGIGFLEQTAAGTFNLGGFDTTIGSLSGAGSVLLGAGRLTTGVDGVNTLFEGVISGTGGLTKTGNGTLVLTGTNSYGGGTTIAGGTLQLGNGNTAGSIIGPVLNNGTFAINRSDAYTFSGVISGSGVFVQAGSGTTTLTGANSYSGGTLISGGRLIGNTISLQGLIQNNAALEFAQATNGVFAGQIGGSGVFDKTGAGLLELTGNNGALGGATTVRAGELRVTGSLASSLTTVLSGATLSGNGTVGGLIARSGSVIAPGAGGLGTLGVNGAVQLLSGSTLRLQVQAAQGSDALIGNGALQLGGTAALTNLRGTYAFNSRYVLLQTSGARTGTFDAVTGLAEFGILYRPELVYTANQVLLRMAPNLLTNIVGSTGLTANQRSVVSRIDAAVTAGYNPQPLFNVYSLPTAQLPNAFDQISGEVYATMAGVGIEQERLVREAVLGRVATVAAATRQTPEWGNGAGAWGQVFGSWGDGDRDGNAARYESDRQGFITGIDYGNANSEGSWRIGAFGLNMTSKVSVDARGSRAEVEQTGGGLYAGANSGGFSVGLGASITGVDLTAVRNITLPGFVETNRGRGDGRALQGFADLSYTIEDGYVTYRPFVMVAGGQFRLDALNETGGAAALAVRRQSYTSASFTVGADGAVRMGKVQLSGTVAGRFQVGDRDPAAKIALAAAPGQAFTVAGVQLDDFALSAKLDATLKLGRNADFSLGYTGLIGKSTADHGARATLSVRF